MANPWVRLWVDMPNDPKFRTVASKSKQSISSVIAVYVHMLCCASNATERGRTQGWNDEDIASALDMDSADITAIREAMEGRLLDGDYLTGWDKRQPIKEDGAAARAKAWRDEQKAERERDRTRPNAKERQDTDTDTDKIKTKNIKSKTLSPDGDLFDGIDPQIVSDFKALRNKKKSAITKTAMEGIRREAGKAGLSLADALMICCERGWAGFKAEWVTQPSARASPASYESAKDRSRREASEQLTGRKRNEQPNFIDIN